MATLVATFDPDTAATTLTIDGTTWGTVPATVTCVRRTPGGQAVKVRGIIDRPVSAGYLVAVDHEMDTDSLVTYTVTGYTSAGVLVAETTQTTVNTATGGEGIYLKAPGRPDLTVLADIAALGDLLSETIGDTYQVLRGDPVSISQWSGVTPEHSSLLVRTERGTATAAIRKLLDNARVLLIQPAEPSDVEQGWYFVRSRAQSNPGEFDAADFRHTSLEIERTTAPSGEKVGGVWTWAALAATYATWDDVADAYASWFEVAQGPAE